MEVVWILEAPSIGRPDAFHLLAPLCPRLIAFFLAPRPADVQNFCACKKPTTPKQISAQQQHERKHQNLVCARLWCFGLLCWLLMSARASPRQLLCVNVPKGDIFCLWWLKVRATVSELTDVNKPVQSLLFQENNFSQGTSLKEFPYTLFPPKHSTKMLTRPTSCSFRAYTCAMYIFQWRHWTILISYLAPFSVRHAGKFCARESFLCRNMVYSVVHFDQQTQKDIFATNNHVQGLWHECKLLMTNKQTKKNLASG